MLPHNKRQRQEKAKVKFLWRELFDAARSHEAPLTCCPADESETHALLKEALAELEHSAAERDSQLEHTTAVHAELESELQEVRAELLVRDQELRATRYMARDMINELENVRTQLLTVTMSLEPPESLFQSPLWDESRGLNMEVLELSAALDAERRKGETVAAALDHVQCRLDEANKRLERHKREKGAGYVGTAGMSRMQVLYKLLLPRLSQMAVSRRICSHFARTVSASLCAGAAIAERPTRREPNARAKIAIAARTDDQAPANLPR